MCDIMKYEFVRAEDTFDDNNDGLVFGINWLDDMGNVVDCQWFKTENERQICIDETKNELLNR